MKVIILTCGRRDTASNCLPLLCNNENIEVERVILANGLSPNKWRLYKNKIKKIFKIGVLGALNGIRIRKWYNDNEVDDLEKICQEYNVPFFETEYINCKTTQDLFLDSNSDLGLSLGNGYIPHSVFSIPKYGMINVHGEILPNYQNAQSIIWPIYMMDKNTGLTIHQIDRHIDTGNILYQDKYPIEFHHNLEDTVRSTLELTRQRVPAAITYVCENYEDLIKDKRKQEGGLSYTTPSIWQFLRIIENNRVMSKRLI